MSWLNSGSPEDQVPVGCQQLLYLDCLLFIAMAHEASPDLYHPSNMRRLLSLMQAR
jgi:hypothetical protein